MMRRCAEKQRKNLSAEPENERSNLIETGTGKPDRSEITCQSS